MINSTKDGAAGEFCIARPGQKRKKTQNACSLSKFRWFLQRSFALMASKEDECAGKGEGLDLGGDEEEEIDAEIRAQMKEMDDEIKGKILDVAVDRIIDLILPVAELGLYLKSDLLR